MSLYSNNLNKRLKKNERDRSEVLSKLRITIYGSYEDIILNILKKVKTHLRDIGFAKTMLVEDYPDTHINDLAKSYYYIENSDINLLFFFKRTDNSSVTKEGGHVLKVAIPYSIFFEEKKPYDEYGAIKALFKDDIKGYNIDVRPFSRRSINKIAETALREYIYSRYRIRV